MQSDLEEDRAGASFLTAELATKATEICSGQGKAYESNWGQILRASSAVSVLDQNQASFNLRGWEKKMGC